MGCPVEFPGSLLLLRAEPQSGCTCSQTSVHLTEGGAGWELGAWRGGEGRGWARNRTVAGRLTDLRVGEVVIHSFK